MGAGQFGRQVEAVVDVTAVVNLGQAGDGVTSCGDGAHAGNACEQGEYRIGETVVGHDRAGPGSNRFQQLQRNINMFDMVGAAVLREVLPGGVGVDAQNELVVVFFDEVEGSFRQVVGRVIDQVTMPGNGAGSTSPVSVAILSTQAASKRPNRSATGSSTWVMPPTEMGPGMTRTARAG